ncbi:MAG TPA: DNA-3-methyladenine glycosylase 2 family protein, partial [Candidatus Colwellbacteria bacterium]|nr:DNA-3-methyladenine glycosylase 2 family protein [Candidatus Colwellbacteria bacterium]
IMRKVLAHFKKNDPKIYFYLQTDPKIERLKPKDRKDYFSRLCVDIIFQQISGKAGDAILAKFRSLFPKKRISAKKFLALGEPEIRAAGISAQKAKYLKSLAEHFCGKKIRIKDFDKMTDEEVITELTRIKGIGRWTAEMFLMSTLGRENVFSAGDLGLRKGLMKVYGFDEYPPEKKVEKITSAWAPYKTYGCLALWRSNDMP